jgi:hypothetical protein
VSVIHGPLAPFQAHYNQALRDLNRVWVRLSHIAEIRRYQTTGSAVSKYCNAEVSLSVLTHPSVDEAEVSIWSPHSSITGTFGRICLRLRATSKLACSLARLSSKTAATECMRYSRATPCAGLFALTTLQPVSLFG